MNSPFGIVLGHNGNLTNTEQLKNDLFRQDLRHVNTNSDSEVLLNVLAHELQEAASELQARPGDDLRSGVRRAPALSRRLRGGRDDRGLRAARVPRSLRHPSARVRAMRRPSTATEYLVASESVALDTLGFELVRDVGARRGDLHRPRRQLLQPPVRAERVSSIPASSSSCIWRAPIR